jgi:phage terminase large subunit GpA-like protein
VLSRRVWDSWIPPDRVRAVQWIPDNIVIPEETETPGLFDLDLFPHVRGVLEAIEDPLVRQIYMQWSVRNAKTTTALAALIFFAVNAPRPMLFGSSTDDKADDTIDSQLYPMLEACAATREQLKPEHQRNKRFVALRRCRIRKSFSGSPSSMAGFPACYGHAGEVSKWTTKKSFEADPVKLFTKRALLYPFESKYFFESSPGTKGNCRIGRLMNDPGTDRRRRYVPCPHCGEFQLLKMGTGQEETGGLRWDKRPGEHSERPMAVASAWYECQFCFGRIEDRHRPAMMRAGVWLSEGQSIDRKGKIAGKPRVASPNVGFGPLSALYSLAISGWGQLVGEFLDSRNDSESRRDFKNSVEAEEWDPQPVKVHAHELAERLASPDAEARRLCPAWSVFLTMAVDVQAGGEQYEWQATAWGPHSRGHLVDYGVCYSEADVEALIRGASFPHADRGNPLRPARVLLDARDGHVTERIYAFCRRVPGCLPCMGSRHSAFPEFCRPQSLDGNPTYKRAAAAQVAPTHFSTLPLYLEINTERTQRWVQTLIETDPLPGQPPIFTVNAEAAMDFSFLDQLLNEYAHDEVDNSGYLVSAWRKTGKNEQRDALRYNRALAELLMQNGRSWPLLKRIPNAGNAPQQQSERPAGFTTPDGRPFLVTER